MSQDRTITIKFSDEEFRLLLQTMGRLGNMPQYDGTPAFAIYERLLHAFHGENQ